MYVLHDRTRGVAEIHHGDDQPPTVLTGVNRHQLAPALWDIRLTLGRTSHWAPQRDGRFRHGLDPAPGGHED